MRPVLLFLACLALSPLLTADESARRFLQKPDSWFASTEAKQVAAIILSFQTDAGGWPKNTDTISKAYSGDRAKLQPTFDNKATVDELRFMARMVNATQDATCRQSFDRGLAYVLAAQYANGGFPQWWPNPGSIAKRITLNDGVMIGIMNVLKDAADRGPDFAWLDETRRLRCAEAEARGTACLLKMQVTANGRRTGWGQQHDEKTFETVGARTFELSCIAPGDTVAVVEFLMRYERPSAELVAAGKTVKILTVGKKGREQLRRDWASHFVAHVDLSAVRKLGYTNAQDIARDLLGRFDAGEYDVATIFFSRFQSVIAQIPTAQQIIPAKFEEAEAGAATLYDYEPSEEAILADLLPRGVATQIFAALLENAASEQGARMSAMDNATRNAGDMIDRLTIEFNRSRQAVITNELIEIISGAEAL